MPKWLLDIRGRVPTQVAVVLGMVPIVLGILLWWLLTRGRYENRVISYNILPSPAEVWQEIFRILEQTDLAHHLFLSIKRVVFGYLVALAVVLPLGVQMASFGVVRAFFAPVTSASGYIPIATLVPLSMAWFGLYEKQKVMFLAIAFGIYLLPLVIGAIDSVPDVYLKTASTLGANRFHLVFRVLIPVALPSIWQGMRMAFGVGWTYLVLAESVVQTGGLGDVVINAQRQAKYERVYLVIILITLIAWVADLAWVQLGNLLFPYRRTR